MNAHWGFPIKDLETIVTSLRKLNERAIPRVRGKAVYHASVKIDAHG